MGTSQGISATHGRTGQRERAPQKTFGCGGCRVRWWGRSTAHCPSCHQTFTGVSGFDQHRRDGACRPPAEAGLEPKQRHGYHAWGRPDSGWRER